MTIAEHDPLTTASTQLLIGGKWRSGERDATFEVFDPSTGSSICDVADASANDAIAALDAACQVQSAWAATAPRERSEMLRRAFELMMTRRDELASLVTLEMGKPLAESIGEINYAAEFLRWFSEEAVRVHGEYRMAPSGSSKILTTRQPVGPSLLVTPWNFPMAMVTRKIGPAIAAGCTTIVKPAEQTPLSALVLGEILREAGVPDGVCNIVPTSRPQEVVTALLGDPRLRKLSFTGSTQVGRLLMSQAAGNLLRLSMELGGNNPFMVLADADIEAAVEGAMVAKLRNMGQSCVAANRFLVHAAVAEEFSDRLTARLGSLRVGPGGDEGVDVGPLIDEAQRQRVAGLVDDATRAGATVRVGGSAPSGAGYFYAPTVLEDVSSGAAINREEIFGPVASIRTFASDEEVLVAANETVQGLAAFVYTRNLGTALRAVDSLECGMVGINRGLVSEVAAPFGGIKHSGLGREGGSEGIHEYLSVKYAAIQI